MVGSPSIAARRRRSAVSSTVVGVVATVAVGLLVGACATGPGPEVTGDDPGSGPVELVDEGGSAGPVAVVERVIDGDSLEVVAGGEELEVRLLGINAPERFTLADAETCVGRRAGDTLRAVLDAASASGQLLLVGDETDRFGRRLADLDLGGVELGEVDLGGVDLGIEETGDRLEPDSEADGGRPWTATTAMVASGWALALWSADDPDLTGAMLEAAAARRGWWGDECGAPPAGLVISDHRVDPRGDDRENLDDEWVDVTNDGADAVDLSGWTIRDETTSNRFLIDGVVLAPGATVRFRTGRGPSSDTDVYLDERFPVWSNRGETVLLLDPEGRIAAHAFVP